MHIGISKSNIWQLSNGFSIDEEKGAGVQDYLKSNFCLSNDTDSCVFLIVCQCVVSAQELFMI